VEILNADLDRFFQFIKKMKKFFKCNFLLQFLVVKTGKKLDPDPGSRLNEAGCKIE
jgi:hypothetical protein